VDNEVTQTGVEMEQRSSRRGVIAAGVGGAALSLLPFLSGRADAADTTTTASPTTASPTTVGTTTTTAPPKRPTDSDIALLTAAQKAEFTALALYGLATARVKGWSAAETTVVTTLASSHQAYANAFSGMLGRIAPNAADETILGKFDPKFTGSPADVLKAAADLESALVATHLDILGQLQGVNGATQIAAIVTAEARHVTALRDLAGSTSLSDLLVDTEAASLLGNG
jgi:hypothetical protein